MKSINVYTLRRTVLSSWGLQYNVNSWAVADPGGGGGGLGIDFYSGFMKNGHGGVQIVILKDPGIYFHSGLSKNVQGGGVQFEI